MHYGVDLGNMEALWKRALHELDGSCSARSSDDEKERAFWHGYFEKKTEYCPDEYSRPIAAAVRAILTDKHPDTILEIGPGKTLTSFVKKTAPGIQTYHIDTADDFETVAEQLKGAAQ